MPESISIALIGDYDSAVTAHAAIPKALEIAGSAVGLHVEGTWLASGRLAGAALQRLASFDAAWCVPGSPYASMEGALESIRCARETGLPFLGTCGGYQHAVLEFARTVLGLEDAGNTEVDPDTATPLIAPLSCALVEQTAAILFSKGSYMRRVHGADEVVEGYHCSYGVNPEYLPLFAHSALRFTGFDARGEPRCFELHGHPFFIGTAYQPERSASTGAPHPLIVAFMRAAAGKPS